MNEGAAASGSIMNINGSKSIQQHRDALQPLGFSRLWLLV